MGRIAVRFLVAVAASAAADLLWWLHEPRQLTAPIDTVGYPTFANWDYIPSFLGYRLVIYAFPVGVLAVYSLLAWRGPLRRPARARRPRATAQMLDLPPAEPVAELGAEPGAGRGWMTSQALGMAARLLLPALVVVVAASARSTSDHQKITHHGLLPGLAYLVGVLVLAVAIARLRTRPSPLRWAQVRSAIAAVNGIGGAMASVFGLWFVSRHSVVVVLNDNSAHHWPWLPAWLAGLGMLIIAAWGLLRLRSGRPPAAVEKRLLAVVGGAAAIFLVTSRIPGQLGAFQGYDDAMDLVGAHLLSQGYFPWRDIMLIHGPWTDALRATIAFSVFGNTRWGGDAGGTVLLGPLCWVVVYLFATWFSRRNRWFLVGLVLLVLSGIPDSYDGRFILAPVILVLLGEVLRRRSLGWCAAFMVVLVSQAILVPETLFLAIPALLVIVAADLTHRPPGTRIWAALRRSEQCAAVGAVLTVAWCAYLAANHSLGAWIEYFKIFGPGHNVEGAHGPRNISPRDWIEFWLAIALILVTFWSAVARVRGGRSWSPRDWVTVAAAGFVALYGEEALGRFDAAHITIAFTAAVPLALLWLEQALTAADGLVRAMASGARRRRPLRNVLAACRPATVLVVAVTVVMAPQLTGAPSALVAADSIPSQEHATSVAEPTIPRLGYIAPGDMDPTLLRDLTIALHTYAGNGGSVFDMTNSLGYIYYLLDQRPASPFVHVSMAMTPYAQQLLVGSLRHSRPPVVIFDSNTKGVPRWDFIRNDIRHYDVSQYLLSNYQPVLQTHGLLLLLRNDLMARRPPLPRLGVPAVSTDLYFSSPACVWGDIPNFLSSPASGSSVELPVTSQGSRMVTTVAGWAVDVAAHAPVRMLVLASGAAVLDTLRPNVQRPDVGSLVGEYALDSGFSATVIRRASRGAITVYGLTADGMLHPLSGQPNPSRRGVLRLPGGADVRVGAPIRGNVDTLSTQAETIGVARIPAGVTIAHYDLLTLHADNPIGPAEITISDNPAANASHDITADVLPSSGATLGVRVGSCLQWHGYQTHALYVAQTRGALIGRLQLSGVGN